MFKELIEVANNAVIDELSDTTATNSRTKKNFPVIFDSEFTSLDFSESTIDSFAPTILIHSEIDIKKGDQITIESKGYFAESLQPDGHGLMLVRLYSDGNDTTSKNKSKKNTEIETW